MGSCEFVATITALACTISNCCTKEEITLLAAVLPQLGDTLATILVLEENRSENCNPTPNIVSGTNDYTI